MCAICLFKCNWTVIQLATTSSRTALAYLTKRMVHFGLSWHYVKENTGYLQFKSINGKVSGDKVALIYLKDNSN